MKLVLAEKPSMAKDIADVLGANLKKQGYFEGNGYVCTYAFGHLVSIHNPEGEGKWLEVPLPILSDFKLVADFEKKSQLKIIENLLKNADEIICATDAGREGELIFRYIYHYLKCKKPFYRLWISSLTPSAIKEGFANLKSGSDYDHLYLAAKARSESDWYVGVNATRALTITINNKDVFSLGRVQTPTLAIICKRYQENVGFVSEPYWMLEFCATKDGQRFTFKYAEKYSSYEAVDKVFTELEHSKLSAFLVKNVATKEIKDMQPLLYDLTGLQKKASSKYGIIPDDTLKIAQKLYESKYITYPRTGSRYIPNDVFDNIPNLLKACSQLPLSLDIAYFDKNPALAKRCVDGSKVTDHHALLPTSILPDFDMLTKYEQIIYKMIVTNMFEAFAAPCVKDVTTVIIEVKGLGDCKVTGSVIKDAGWRSVASQKNDVEENDACAIEEKEQSLPHLIKGDMLLKADDTKIIKDQTKPKPLLTDSSLLSFMETAGKDIEDEEAKEAIKDCGLGTPATRDNIIKELIRREYIVREKKKLIPTQKGLFTYEIVKDKTVSSPTLTGEWEKNLNQIAAGKYPYEKFMNEIKNYCENLTKEILSIEKPEIKNQKTESLPICPVCGKHHVRLFPKGIGCVSKECGFVVWRTIAGKELTDYQLQTLVEKGQTAEIKGFISKKSGKTFSAIIKLVSDPEGGFKTSFLFKENKK